jgi:hypothetical protein
VAQFYADRVSLGSHRARTPEGYLIALAVPFARTGVQTYKAEEIDKDSTMGLSGLVNVYRPKEEVLSKAAIISFEGKSVTSLHPPQFLDTNNDMVYSRGHIQNVRAGSEPLPDGEWPIVGDIIVKDATLIQQIEDDLRAELSAGYTYDLERAPHDEHDPGAKFVQRNIRGNHVAIVSSARGGENLRILDAKPEKGAEMPEPVVTPEKPGMLAELATFCKTLGLRLVASDEDPGAVERNRKKDEEALKLKSRVEDADDPKMDKEDKKAGAPKDEPQGADKKAKDDKDDDRKAKDDDSKHMAADAKLDRVIDLLERVVARDAKCTCDAEEGEAHKKDCPMNKKESEDADLIPIHKLHGEEIPINPIPGADQALEHLRQIKPLVAKSGDRKAIDAYNKAVRQLKEASDSDATDADYGDFTKLKKPEKVENDEQRVRASDSKDKGNPSEDFEAAAAKFHRINPNQVKKQ